jgi:hypothetical protein
MLFVIILLVIFVIVPGVIFFKMEIGITNDRLQWLEERLTKLEKDAVKITFTGEPEKTHFGVKHELESQKEENKQTKKRKPKSVKDWEDNFDLGGHE